FLMQFPEFQAFREESRGSGDKTSKDAANAVADSSASETPEESMERANSELRSGMISEVLEKIRALTPRAFEQLVVDVLVKMGYGGLNENPGQVVGGSGDKGIDGIISQDPLGLDRIHLQAKQWGQPVGRPEVQKFVGALHGQGARKGIFITSSEFTKDARDYAERLETRVILIDGKRLAELMFAYNVGVTAARRYEVKRIDSDYFAELEGTID
ncbi:MAG: restriction endonuclease, partial [Syntrophomonadaceae bacterium]|nr:restriction endonuclease [Syntrophomonadaceae bacterium]